MKEAGENKRLTICTFCNAIQVTQYELHDLIRNLEQPKNIAELSEKLSIQIVAVKLPGGYSYSIIKKDSKFFCSEDNLIFYYDVEGLMLKLNIPYKNDNWRLFIDTSKHL
ncbi:hypothetical protein J437_LFUL004835 [Ladona fulva]|uniref:Uncharacterized protein n=1 Tax=Ladona fulva TaxID=123851 RepID=A0A8K0NZ07_LADFU|nr:hypothetical protein J437_LFUL004835 [Ladona fulva]